MKICLGGYLKKRCDNLEKKPLTSQPNGKNSFVVILNIDHRSLEAFACIQC